MSFPKIPTHLRGSGLTKGFPLVEASPGYYTYETPMGTRVHLCTDTMTVTSSKVVRTWDEELGCFVCAGAEGLYPVWEEDSDEDRVHE